MRISLLAPAAALFALFSLPAQAVDLGSLTSKVTGHIGVADGNCKEKTAELQAKFDEAEASGNTLKAAGYKAALEQANKGCKVVGDKTAEAKQKVDGVTQETQAKADKSGVSALGGLLK